MKLIKDNVVVVEYGNSEKFSNFTTNGYELCEESDSTRKILRDHLRYMLGIISEKDIKEFVKEVQDLLHTVMCDVLNKNSEPIEQLYYSYVEIDDLTHLSFKNNVQLGKYFETIEIIFRKFEHFKDLEIDQQTVYRYLSQPALYKRRDYKKHDNKDISFLYFSLSFCLSMYENFNSEPIQPNFEEDYTLEMNRILIKNYLIPTYLLFKSREDTIM